MDKTTGGPSGISVEEVGAAIEQHTKDVRDLQHYVADCEKAGGTPTVTDLRNLVRPLNDHWQHMKPTLEQIASIDSGVLKADTGATQAVANPSEISRSLGT